MKSLTIKTAIAFLFSVFAFSANAQMFGKKAEITVKSTVECEFCKKNVESNLSKVKGIRKVTADHTKREITVSYNPKKITPEEIKKKITEIGYDADELKANNRMTQMLKHKEQQQIQKEEPK